MLSQNDKVLVSVRGLSACYGSTVALCDSDLDVFSSDFLGIIGPNGGGKTTLIKAILGMVPYTGKIEYDDSITRGSHLRIGYLPQVNDFDPSFPIKVKDVILSGLQSGKGITGRYNSADRDKVKFWMNETGIGNLAERPIGKLSGGQMQRALLCRSLISEPGLLILDEPANFVDNKFEHELYGILKKLNERMAIIMVSHDLGTISSVVKSIICVNKHVHRHDSNLITAEQLKNYDCPIQIISHGHVPHTVLENH